MFFFFPIVCGINNWDSPYKPKTGNEALRPEQYNGLYCPNCHNYSVGPVKRKEFFCIWFVPVVPLYWGKQLRCPICNWRQDFKDEQQLIKVVNEQQHLKSS